MSSEKTPSASSTTALASTEPQSQPKLRATNEALSTFDIIQGVFSFLYDLDPQDADKTIMRRNDLVSCALVSKAFLSPALAEIWRSLKSLVPLLKLLPNFIPDEDSGFYSLQGKIEDASWALFDARAALVREYIYTDYNFSPGSRSDVVLKSVYFRLAQLRPIIFPSLRSFRCHCSDSLFDTLEVLLFLSPRLEVVEFRSSTSTVKKLNVISFMSFIVHDARNLSVFEFEGKISETLVTLLCHLDGLVQLELKGSENMDAKDVRRLGRLPHLRHFTLHANVIPEPASEDALDVVVDDGNENLFREISHLALCGPRRSIDIVLDFVHTNSLQRIDLGVSNPDLEHYLAVLSKLGARWPATLTTIRIVASHASWTDFDPDAYSSEAARFTSEDIPLTRLLQPLHQWPHLEEITIEDVLSWRISVAQLRDIGSSWPKLERLGLKLDSISFGSLPSVTALDAIARSCPALKELKLSIDVHDIPPLCESHYPSSTSHGLETLFIHSRYNVSNKVALVRHVDHAFPRLRNLDGPNIEWTEIRDVLKLCQSVRAAERRRRLPGPA